MPTFTGSITGGAPSLYKFELIITETGYSIAGNYTDYSYTLRIRRTASTPYSSTWGSSTYSLNINGTIASGTGFSLNFPAGGPMTQNLRTGTRRVTHNSDGTKSINMSASFTSGTSAIGNGSLSVNNWTLRTIPRASQPSVSGPVTVSGSGGSLTINTNKLASFTHDLTYSFGALVDQPITTGVVDSYNWSVPASILNQIPNATSGSGTIKCVTKSGSTVIGTKSVSFTVNVHEDVKPNMAGVTFDLDEGTTSPNVAALVGAFVQGHSKLDYTLSGAVGANGSTITKYELLVGTQVIGGATGLTAPLSVSGTVPVTARVTDSRGRVNTKSTNITVLAWEAPKINSTDFQRSTGLTPNPEGTDILITINASVSSLVSGTQKNVLKYKTLTRDHGETSWTVPPAVVRNNITHGSITMSLSYYISGPFPILESHDVRVEISDLFATSNRMTTVGVAAVVMHVTPDGLMGFGKYWEQGYDFADDVYANGNLLLPAASNAETQAGAIVNKAVTPASLASRTATESRTGISEIATQAETDAGTDDTRFVTPKKLRGTLALPPIGIWYHNGSLSISAGSWTDIAGSGVQFDIDRPLRVMISLNAWLVASAGELRVGVAGSGADSFSPITAGWGAVMYRSPVETNGTAQRTSTWSRDIPAGITTFRVQAYQTGGGTKQVNYPAMYITPVAWLDE